MTIHYENYEHLPLIPLKYGLITVIASILFFQFLNYLIKLATSNPDTKEDYISWKWRNLLISWVHALIVGTWDLSCFYLYPELTTDLIAFQNMYIYSMVAFSTGYFFHDFIDIMISGRLYNMWEVIPHHIAVSGMFFYNVIQCRCISYNVVALLAEVNTIFLHSRKLLQISKIPYTHWLYRFNSVMNIFTFVSCRFLGLAWIVHGMCNFANRVSPIYFYVLAAAMFIMWGTNIMLFWRLLKSDFIRPILQSTQKSSRKELSMLQTNGKHYKLNGIEGVNGCIPPNCLSSNGHISVQTINGAVNLQKDD